MSFLEIWDLYTIERIKTNKTHNRGDEIPKGFYHIGVEILTIIDSKKILLTQRHRDKHFGLFWECTGGSLIKDEISIEGAIRELHEEIGLVVEPDELNFVSEYLSEDTIYDVYVTYQKKSCLGNLKLQEEEVVDFQCVSFEEFNFLLANEVVVPKLKYFNNLIEDNKINLNT